MRAFHTKLALGMLVSATVLPLPSARAASFTVYDTGNNSELISYLDGGTEGNIKKVLYSLDVGPINPGDILVVTSEGELRDQTSQNASRLSSQLILGSSASATIGTELDENNAFNTFAGSRIGVVTKLATKGFPAGSNSTFVNLVVWDGPDDYFTVDKDYGRLQVLKIEP